MSRGAKRGAGVGQTPRSGTAARAAAQRLRGRASAAVGRCGAHAGLTTVGGGASAGVPAVGVLARTVTRQGQPSASLQGRIHGVSETTAPADGALQDEAGLFCEGVSTGAGVRAAVAVAQGTWR